MHTAADLAFDRAAHRSYLPDGQEVYHVTRILGDVGVCTDFEDLAAISPRVAESVRLACERGTAVHADCHAYDDDDLDLAACDVRVHPYVEAWAECRDVKGLAPLAHARERRVFHPLFNYTGILDGIFLCGGRRILVDIKTGNPEDAAAHIQTAAYELAWTHEHPDQPIDERWAVWLTPRNRIPYRITNYTARPDAHLDVGRWQACLVVFNEQRGRRRCQR